VFLGPAGLGSIQKRELQLALVCQAERETSGQPFRVLPVLLPNFDRARLPGFAALNTWIELADPTQPLPLLHAVQPAPSVAAPASVARICPFRALNAFREEDAPLYFGREREADSLLQLVHDHPFVAVVGPSGSGKSSLVQAGLFPRIRLERPPRATWDAIVYTPGKRPFYYCASALARIWMRGDAGVPALVAEAETIERRLLSGEGRLASYVHEAIARLEGADRLLIVVDQFEELFTLVEDEAVRRAFVDALFAAVVEERCSVVVTLRADFYGRAIELGDAMSGVLVGAQLNIGPMAPDQLRRAIVGPSTRAGLTLDDGLVNRILDDVAQQPGSLPLVEFALTELWNTSAQGRLTHAGYEQVGKVADAIGARAEGVLKQLSTSQQQIAPAVLTRLVRVSSGEDDGANSRQRVRVAYLEPDAVAVLQKFADARIAIFDREDDGNATVGVVHEALIRNWSKLREWVDQDSQFLLWRQRLDVYVSEWERTEGNPSTLLTGILLEDAWRWTRTHGRLLNARERRFLDASRRRQKGSLAIRWMAAAVVTLAVTVAAGYWLWTRTDVYQVRQAIVNASLRDAVYASFSDDDQRLETIEGWISVMTRTGRERLIAEEVDRNGLQECSKATVAAERRALAGGGGVLPEIRALTESVTQDNLKCLALLPLSSEETKLADAAAQNVRPDAQASDYRPPIEAARLLLRLNNRAAARDLVHRIVETLATARPQSAQRFAFILVQRVGTPLSRADRDRLGSLPLDTYYAHRTANLLLIGDASSRNLDEAVRKAVGPSQFYDDSVGAAAGAVLARAVRESGGDGVLDAATRLTAASSNDGYRKEAEVALLLPPATALAETGRCDAAVRLAEQALILGERLDNEERRSRELVTVASVFASCGQLARARGIADRCARALDKLRAYTAIVARGSGITLRRAEPTLWNVSSAEQEPTEVTTNSARPKGSRVFRFDQQHPPSADLQDRFGMIADSFADYLNRVGFPLAAPIHLRVMKPGTRLDTDAKQRTAWLSEAAATDRSSDVAVSTAVIVLSSSVKASTNVANPAALYYVASFANAPRIALTGLPVFDLSNSATLAADSDFDEFRPACALWDIRAILGQNRTDRLVALAIKSTRSGEEADAFADALIRVSGDAAETVRGVLTRHGLVRNKKG
jgi:hypothetical protein